MGIRVRLISNDPALGTLLAGIARRWPAPFSVVTAEGDEDAEPVHLHIWDCEPEIEFPAELDLEREEHLFLMRATELERVRALLPSSAAPVRILLKPVQAKSLAAFIEQSLGKQGGDGRPADEDLVALLRSDQEALLQYLLEAKLQTHKQMELQAGFIERTARDLRAPLTALYGYFGLLLERQLGPVTFEQAELLRHMQLEAARLLRVADRMLLKPGWPRERFQSNGPAPDYSPATEAARAEETFFSD